MEYIENLEELKILVEKCEKCKLCKTRHNVVFGEGKIKSKIMFVGEGPGENEDIQGRPFVGLAGKLLDKMLGVIDLSRETNIYITNIVKCRPPQNRDPESDEQEACINYLNQQIKLINPKIIVALGRVAAKKLIDPNFKVTMQHGQWFLKDDIYMMGTYHPAALLRFPSNKEIAFQDFLQIREKLRNIN